MLRPLIAGNWKMHKTAEETRLFFRNFLSQLITDVEIRIYPPATSLWAASDLVKESPVGIGAQNVHFETSGAYTGELSAEMVQETGASSVLVGHSERRQMFAETDDIIARKVETAIKANLDVILCVGETLEQREAGQAETVISGQLERGLSLIKQTRGVCLDIAYEPIWAIGTGQTATSDQAQQMHRYIRTSLENTSAKNARILYGGSVKPENAAELLGQPDINGVLVGGASLDVESFAAIATAAFQP